MPSPSVFIGDWTSLKGTTDIGKALLNEQLEANVVEFFKWGLLGIGAFSNVTIPSSGNPVYGGDYSKLRLSEDSNFLQGCVWESARMDWVWESGVQYSIQPIAISGVYVNSTFYPNGSLVPQGSGFHINYPLGRVLFDNPLPASSVIQCEYSYRNWQFSTGSVPWFRQIQFNSYRIDDFQFSQYGSGTWSILSENRVQLPHVVIDAVPRRTMIPFELGRGARVNQDIVFHVFAEQPYDMKAMHDIITFQWQKSILLFDKNLMTFSLDYYGSIASGARCYPDLVAPQASGGFAYSQARFLEMTSVPIPTTPPLYPCEVRAMVQVDVPNI